MKGILKEAAKALFTILKGIGYAVLGLLAIPLGFIFVICVMILGPCIGIGMNIVGCLLECAGYEERGKKLQDKGSQILRETG